MKYTKVADEDHISTNLALRPRMLNALFYPMIAFFKNIYLFLSLKI